MALLNQHDLNNLHTSLYSRFQKYNLNLQAFTNCTSAADNDTPVITYLRPMTEAQNVECIMGRDLPGKSLDLRHHPVIELRARGDGVVLELIIPPDAWCDQRNFVGKMSIERHRSAFRRLLSKLDDRFCLGFWAGTHLDASHLTPAKATHPAIYDTWISTFSHGKDYLRIGVWYDEVTSDMTGELFRQAQALYDIYKFIAWTGNNDFRAFHQRPAAPVYA
jgi:hypothetical protein